MKHFARIFLFIISFLWSNDENMDVKHMIVDYNGKTIECFIDSLGYQFLYFVPKDSVDTDSMKLKDIYYVYNDFDRVFHYSWSFEENVRRMQNRTGKVFTIKGDTLNFIDIQFNKDMINPEVFVKTGIENSEYVSMFDIKKIETDFSIMSYAVERGFYYSFFTFIIATHVDTYLKWDKNRRAVPQIWDQYNDILPKISFLGLNTREGSGVAYESFTSLIPITVLFSMIYDVIKEKNKFYFTPVFEEKIFGRNMYVFSIKNILNTKIQDFIFILEKNKIGNKVLEWFR